MTSHHRARHGTGQCRPRHCPRFPLVGAPNPRQRDPGFATFFDHRQPADLHRSRRAIMGRVNTLLPELHAKAVMEVEGQALRDVAIGVNRVCQRAGRGGAGGHV